MTIGYNTTLRDLIAADTFARWVTAAGTGAKILLCSGTRPGTPGAGTPTILATLTITGALFASTSGNVGTVNTIADVTATGTGTATWGRLVKSDGTTHVLDVSAGLAGSGAELILSTVAIVSSPAATVHVNSMTLTVPG